MKWCGPIPSAQKSDGEGIEAEYACGDEIWKDLFSNTFANLGLALRPDLFDSAKVQVPGLG
jgi:hypothetical protein